MRFLLSELFAASIQAWLCHIKVTFTLLLLQKHKAVDVNAPLAFERRRTFSGHWASALICVSALMLDYKWRTDIITPDLYSGTIWLQTTWHLLSHLRQDLQIRPEGSCCQWVVTFIYQKWLTCWCNHGSNLMAAHTLSHFEFCSLIMAAPVASGQEWLRLWLLHKS